MSTNASPDIELPAQFAAFTPYVSEWAIPDEIDRYAKRHTSTLEEVTEFYNVVNPRMEELGTYLDDFDLETLTPEHEALLNLGLMSMECFPAVDLFNNVHVPQSFPWDKFDVKSPRHSAE